MGLGYGLISCQRSHDDARSWEDLYEQALGLTARAETAGLDSVWLTEHHFVDDGYMPSVLPMAAAMAARTSRIGIGTGVLLAPLHHPIRLAEDAATVALLAPHRFTLGMGLGWMPAEFEALGARLEDRGRSMTEILQILRLAWKGESFHFDGAVHRVTGVGIRPFPQSPPPLVMGGNADAAVRRAARLADGFFSNASPQRLEEQIVIAREELERLGRDPAAFRWIYYQVIHPGQQPDVDPGGALGHAWGIRWKYSDMDASARRDAPISAIPAPTTEELASVATSTLIGPADYVAERLNQLRSRSGVQLELVARSYFPEMSYDQQIEIVDWLAEEVAPHV